MAKTILLADDSSTIRKIVELTFSETEIRVEAVDSGRDALEQIERLRPDLVLADVVMPELSGYDLCRAIKDSARPVPVVLLAGTFEPFDEQRALDCRADGHLVKPFEADVLLQRVRGLLAAVDAAPVEPIAGDAPAEPPADDEALDQLTAEAAESPLEPEDDFIPAAGPPQELVDAVAREVVKRLSEDVVREIAREVVPELATKIIRERIRELEGNDV